MKRFSVMITLGNIGCALLLFSGGTTALAISADDPNIARSEEQKPRATKESKKASKEHVVKRTHHDDRELTKHNDELHGRPQDDRQLSQHPNDNLSKHE